MPRTPPSTRAWPCPAEPAQQNRLPAWVRFGQIGGQDRQLVGDLLVELIELGLQPLDIGQGVRQPLLAQILLTL